MGDAVSGGLTKRVRVGLGYDDVVGYDSGAYKVGQAAGTAVSVATAFVNPCAIGGVMGNAVRGLNAVQGAASALDAGDAFASGDAVGGMMALAGARASFAAGTPILTPAGSVAIESLVAGDLVLSRDEFDAAAPVVARRVVQAFARVSPVLEVFVEGRAVVTTGEHPFWVAGKGWTPASDLRARDVLVSHDGQELPVTAVRDAGRVASVYNVEVEQDHTYFVGSQEWGFSLWAHNKCLNAVQQLGQNADQARRSLSTSMKKLYKSNSNKFPSGEQAHHVVPYELRDLGIVKLAASEGFALNRAGNGIMLGPLTHLGSHPAYTRIVTERLNKIAASSAGKTGQQIASEVQNMADSISKILARMNNTGRKIH